MRKANSQLFLPDNAVITSSRMFHLTARSTPETVTVYQLIGSDWEYAFSYDVHVQ